MKAGVRSLTNKFVALCEFGFALAMLAVPLVPTQAQTEKPMVLTYFTIRASNGQFVTALGGGGSLVAATQPTAGESEVFSLWDLNGDQLVDGDKVRIQAPKGQYLCAEGGGGREIVANRSTPGDWETFTLKKIGTDTYAFRASGGQFVTIYSIPMLPGIKGALRADRQTVGDTETFTLVEFRRQGFAAYDVNIRTITGKFVSAEKGGGGAVNATQSTAGASETFKLYDVNGNNLVDGDKVSIKASNGQYLCAEGGGGREIVANRSKAAEWETFTYKQLDHGRFALQASNGQFVSTYGNGTLVANRAAVASTEMFTLVDLRPAASSTPSRPLPPEDSYPAMISVQLGLLVSIDLIKQPATRYMMGYADTTSGDYAPKHLVAFSKPFYIGRTEVTQAEWKAIMGTNPSSHVGDNLPVENVSWLDVQEFIRKLNTQTGQQFRLPTEAEWEYAASNGSGLSEGSKWPFDEMAWYANNSGGQTHPVEKLNGVLGMYDMFGNVHEWTQDWWGALPSGANARLNPVTDPTGPAKGDKIVVRGGGYSSSPAEMFSRVPLSTYTRRADLGFRLAKTAP